ncbi:MAG: transcription initiation factor IIB, partial [Candidatus Thorarchaeota archaeon]
RTVEILKRSREKGLTIGRDPLGLAAAAIYVASILLDERRTQREIAEVARVTEVTVRNRYKEIVRVLQIDSLNSFG